MTTITMEITGPHRAVMQDAFWRLAPEIRTAHELDGRPCHEGSAMVVGPDNVVGAILARLFSFPRAGKDVHVVLDVVRKGNVQHWRRTFGGRSFDSILSPGAAGSRMDGMLVERFGPLAFGMDAIEVDGALFLVMREWSAFGVPMPKFLLPVTDAVERGENGTLHFFVDIRVPFVGRLVRYEGHLVLEEMARRAAA